MQMTEFRKKVTNMKTIEKLEKNRINIMLNTGAAVFLAVGVTVINTVLTLCGFTQTEALVGSIIAYCSAAYGIPNYIRHVVRLCKERKMLKQELDKMDE